MTTTYDIPLATRPPSTPPTPVKPRSKGDHNAFYGTVEGKAGAVSNRQSNLKAGIKAAARSWQGSIIVELWHDPETDTHWCSIGTAPGSAPSATHTLITCPLSNLTFPGTELTITREN